MELGDSYGRTGGRIVGPKEDKNHTARKVNSGPLWLPESESPTKEHTWAGTRPPHSSVADLQFNLHVGPE